MACSGPMWSSPGPFGIAALKPTSLFGVDLPQLTHGVVWSLTLNILVLYRLLAAGAR